ncbi:hypothetical protein QO004_002077 [Rhizobium mesoamericanum]|nr:hypothetical protein [Rhizobium mesoamericanum]
MEIVPKGSLLTVEARISPADIDQIAMGQSTIQATNRLQSEHDAGVHRPGCSGISGCGGR